MLKLESQTVTSMQLTDVVCDNCGKSCKTRDGNFEYGELNGDWGYGSRWDGEQHAAHLCQDCWQKLLDSFKVRREERPLDDGK